MPTAHTTIIPQTGTDALMIFNSIVKKEFIVFIILGDGPKVQETLTLADDMAVAHPAGIYRKVLWIKDPNLVKEKLEQLLLEDPKFNHPLNECLAIALNKHDKIKDVILKNAAITSWRVDKAYSNASKKNNS